MKLFVLIRERNPHAIEFAWAPFQWVRLDVSQRFAPGQLRKGHDTKMLGRLLRRYTGFFPATLHESKESRPRNEVHDLWKQRLADVRSQPLEPLSICGRLPIFSEPKFKSAPNKLPLNLHPVSLSSLPGII